MTGSAAAIGRTDAEGFLQEVRLGKGYECGFDNEGVRCGTGRDAMSELRIHAGL